MGGRSLYLLIILMFPLSARAQQWTEYRPERGGYRIEMPGVPEGSKTIQPGNLMVISALVGSSDGESVFYTSYVDYPKDVSNGSPRTLLDNARDGALALIATGKSKPVTRGEQNLTMNGFSAKHVVADLEGIGNVMIWRGVIVGNRLITAVYAGHRGSETAPEVVRFINSFQIISR
jgi:hypothetical protein